MGRMAESGLERGFALFIERRIKEGSCLLFLLRWMTSGWILAERRERWATRLSLVHVYEMMNLLIILL